LPSLGVALFAKETFAGAGTVPAMPGTWHPAAFMRPAQGIRVGRQLDKFDKLRRQAGFGDEHRLQHRIVFWERPVISEKCIKLVYNLRKMFWLDFAAREAGYLKQKLGLTDFFGFIGGLLVIAALRRHRG
jgi:hypothetical protein